MSKGERILIVDDDADEIEARAELLRSNGYEVFSAETGDAAVDIVRCQSIALTLLDLHLDTENGLDLLPQLKKVRPEMSMIILTGYGTVNNAFEAMSRGADYFMEKYIQPPSFLTLIEKGLETYRSRRKNVQLERLVAPYQAMIYSSDGALSRVLKSAEVVAGRETTLLLRGETGTGKGLLAHFIHEASPRQRGPFVPLNCATVPPELAESELFGYEPGAFSGGKREGKIGLFEAAHGGTFFLDEIGELQMAVQAKLLNALEHKRFRRLGGTAEIEVDVRLIAATNRNLAQDVADGRFRKDLLYRLNVFPTDLPPLRERQEDVLPLVDHFLRAFYGTQIPKLSPAATELLLAYTWPGNVRELKNVIEHASILCPSSSEILPAHMGLPGVSSEAEVTLDPNLSHPDEAEASGPPPFSVAIEEAERQILRGALESNNWNVSATARTLGLSRDTLHRKIKKYHFMPES